MSTEPMTVPEWAVATSAFNESAEVAELYAALVEAFGALANVTTDADANIPGKDGKKGYAYKYASLGAVMQMVRGPLASAGLAIVQAPGFEHGPSGQTITVTTRLIHKSGEWMEAAVSLEIGRGAGAQAVGSALTYARRYGALSLLGIATSNDDDGAAAHDARPGDWEQQPEATVDKLFAMNEVIGAIAGAVRAEPLVEGWTPTDQEKQLAREFFTEFFVSDPPYPHATVVAIVKTVPQWMEGRLPDPEPTGDPVHDDQVDTPPDAPTGRVTFTDAELDELGVPVGDIIAAVKALKIEQVRTELATQLLSSNGNADRLRARLADHRIREDAVARTILLDAGQGSR